ncbi:O-antigen ligase family protein [Psychromonas sp.]|uniref:O-antigen ligase family protein n=1 Tax=Psychromonas sp. TaxID=1884585 RepID=UPI0039E36337
MLIESIKYNGIVKVLKVISIAYLYPVILVIFSIVLGVSKATEIDGSISYVGGYYHEALISVLILGAMSIFILLVTEQGEKFKKLYLLTFFWFLLVMINYRTTLLASLFIGVFVLFAIYKNTQIISNKIIMVLLVIMVTLVTTIFAPSDLFERFQEIPDAISQYSHFLTLPEYYSEADQDFFSGRIYIWSTYISGALDGTDIQLFFGQGMNAWKERFSVYAHNTFVSFFYELGILGLGIFSLLIVNGYRRILKIKKSDIALSLCGVYTAFVVLNFGTMPLWQVEGIILFSLIIAITEYYVQSENNEIEKQATYGAYTSVT